MAAVVALLMLGFWAELVKPFGPVQENTLPALQVSCRLLPAQTGPLLVRLSVGAGATQQVRLASKPEAFWEPSEVKFTVRQPVGWVLVMAAGRVVPLKVPTKGEAVLGPL